MASETLLHEDGGAEGLGVPVALDRDGRTVGPAAERHREPCGELGESGALALQL